MINALFSSQDGGTKCFTNKNGTHFGWKVILDMYSRECSRRDNGNARMVPRLREAYVLRDSWTKLNVMPAKIMQVSVKRDYLVVILKLVARESFVRVIQLYYPRPFTC